MHICSLALEHLWPQAGGQDPHKPNVLWKDLHQNNGKSGKWGTGSLPNPYWGRQFHLERHLTSVALKKKSHTDVEVGISESFFHSATSLAHSRLIYSFFFMGIRFPCLATQNPATAQDGAESGQGSLHQRPWRTAAVKAAWWKLTEEQQDEKYKYLLFYAFLPSKRCRHEISHWWGIPVHWLTTSYCQNSNCQCFLLTTGED